jgi:hypothetical protein
MEKQDIIAIMAAILWQGQHRNSLNYDEVVSAACQLYDASYHALCEERKWRA